MVLKGVSFSVDRGTVGVLIGPSGAGKTTVVRCVNGLEPFDEGLVAVGTARLRAGLDSDRPAQLKALRRCLGTVFQQFQLFAHLSVLENVIEAPVHVLGKPRDVAVTECSPSSIAWGCQIDSTRCRTNSPAASSKDAPLRGRWPCIPTCSSSTSRPARLIPR